MPEASTKKVLTVSDPGDLVVSGKISRIDEDRFLKEMQRVGIEEMEIQYNAIGAGNTTLQVEMVIPENKANEFLKTLKEGELNDLGITKKLMVR